MDQLVPLVGSLLLLTLVLDGIATMLGQRNFPVTRALFRAASAVVVLLVRVVLQVVGGLFTAIGNAISGAGGGGRGGRQRR